MFALTESLFWDLAIIEIIKQQEMRMSFFISVKMGDCSPKF